MVHSSAKKEEKMSPGLKRNLKLSSSSSGRNLGQECLGWDHHRQEESLA